MQQAYNKNNAIQMSAPHYFYNYLILFIPGYLYLFPSIPYTIDLNQLSISLGTQI